MTHFRWFLLLFVGSLAMVGCNKDAVITVHGVDAVVTFAGRIMDENGTPIPGAQVNAGPESTITDQNGVFRLRPVAVDSRNAILHVKKEGYFEFSRAFVVQDKSVQHVSLQLLTRQFLGVFSGASGGDMQTAEGARVSFSAGGITNSSGAAYTGDVRVYAHYLDPEDPELLLQMPGDLRAIATGGREGVLATFGMLGVEIESPSGEKLNLDPAKGAEIRLPVPAGKAGVAPAAIPLWYYDTERARWIEEGSAQLVGNEYVGRVHHFSFWNCDTFLETVNLEGKVYIGNEQAPAQGVYVQLTILSSGFKGGASTDGSGWFGGAIPKGETILLEVISLNACGQQSIYSQTIGPFSTDVVLPDITINSPTLPFIPIGGKLKDCNGNAVDNGYVAIQWKDRNIIAFTQPGGNFTATLPLCSFGSSTGLIKGYDLETLTESAEQSFDGSNGSVNIGTISACTALNEYVQYSIDGQTFVNVGTEVIYSPDSASTNLFTTIYTTDSLANSLLMRFQHNNQPGTFQLNQLTIRNQVVDMSKSQVSVTVFNTAQNIGDVLEGSFSGTFRYIDQPVDHTLNGIFRVIRDQ